MFFTEFGASEDSKDSFFNFGIVDFLSEPVKKVQKKIKNSHTLKFIKHPYDESTKYLNNISHNIHKKITDGRKNIGLE